MIIENIQNQYLKITSSTLEQAHNTGMLKLLQVTATKNKGEVITKNIDLTTLVNQWVANFTFISGISINQIYVKNILTNVLFPVLEAPILVGTMNMITIAGMIEELISNTFHIEGVTATGRTDSMTVEGLPYNIIMDSIVFSILGAEQTVYFNFASDPDVIISNDKIIIKPSFFTDAVLQEGIYSITIIITTTDNIAIQESTCFFVDITMSGLLQAFVEPSKCDATQMHLLLMHYSLNQGSNNNCNCDNMYEIYNYLAQVINKTLIIEDCGCQ